MVLDWSQQLNRRTRESGHSRAERAAVRAADRYT
jgi:hypothetical protein